MQRKQIIVLVLALAGLLGGAWNWMRYFKKNAPVVAENLEVVRQPSKVEQAFQAEQQTQAAAAAAPAAGEARGAAPVQTVEIPQSLGRNPFLTPEEEDALSRGIELEIPSPADEPIAQDQSAVMPEIIVKGLIQDNISGRYMALVEGRYYGVGDNIGVERIVSLDSNGLVLEYGGRTRQVPAGVSSRDTSSTHIIRMRKTP